MMLLRWDRLPDSMRLDEIRPYYDALYRKRFFLLIKRIFDIVASAFLIILLSLVMLFLGIWVALDSPGEVFFRQERVTRYGRIFKIFKFRTMVKDAEKRGTLVTVGGDPRITRSGKFLRHTRLDELPQLFNVFLGQMSFVGTRPEVPHYVEHYTNEMRATLLIPAGVTSLASIKFKDEDAMIQASSDADRTYIEDILPLKMEYNLKAIKEFSLWGEFKIMLKTVAAVLK